MEIRPATAGNMERVVAASVQTNASHIVSMRFFPDATNPALPGVTTKMRFRDGTQVLSITSVTNPDGRRIEHVLTCTEHVIE